MDYIFGILWALLGLGVLVFIHEMGHFLIARRTGIGVEAFSIGFGRPIYHFYKNGVDWRIGWIPFGGYCKMKGQEDFKEASTKGEPDEFYVRPPWARLLTILGGPAFNVILGIILLTFTTYFIGEKIILNDKIVINPEYTKELSSLKNGDIIKEIDGNKVTSWNDIKKFLLMEGIDKETYKFAVERNNKLVDVDYSFDKSRMIKGDIGFSISHKVKIKEVVKGSPAEKAGLKADDIILSIDNQEVNSSASIIHSLNKPQEKTTHKLIIERKGKSIDFKVTPKLTNLPDSDKKIKQIGVKLEPSSLPTMNKNYSLLESIPKGLDKGWGIITLFVKQFKLLSQVDGDTVRESVSGPVGIIVHIGKAGNKGFADFIVFIAIISILLGIFNLLPIPAVDGGHVILTTIEMVRRKPFSLKFIQNFQMVGLFIILTIFVLATANDISKFLFK